MSEGSQERRTEERVPSNEAVCFTDASGWGDLCVGSVHDRSPRGVGIQTDAILPIGTSLEIEVVSTGTETSDAPQFSTGTVSRIQHLPQGGYILGVQLDAPKVFPAHVLPESTTQSAPPEILPKDAEIIFRKIYPKSTSVSTPEKPKPIPVKKSSVAKKSHHNFAQYAVSVTMLALAVTLFLGWGVQELLSPDTVAGSGNSLASSYEATDELALAKEEEETSPAMRDGQWSGRTDQTDSALESEAGWATLEPIHAAPSETEESTTLAMKTYPLSSEAPQATMESNQHVPKMLASLKGTQGGGEPVAQMHAMLQAAQESERNGNHQGALYLSKQAVESSVNLPVPWQQVAKDFRQQLVRVSEAMPVLPEWNNGVSLSQSLPEVPANASVVVHVDKSDFLMKVVKDGKVIWQFPIGLGINGSTPEGIFSVGNKISLPEWYNKGNPVKGGAKNNPLGDSWLGLSDQGTSTPIGIHPTKKGESIGEALSGGCIRMRPEDAERLYKMIPIGTPIVIRA